MKNIPFILLLSCFFSLSACQTKQKAEKEKPERVNVLFIAVDDLKPVIGCYGDKKVLTPNIDRLAETGFVFLNNHCQQAVCAPSRASILTGKRPDNTEVWDLKTLIRDKKPDITTMPQFFRENGYKTAAVGKVFDLRSVDEKHDSLSWSIPYQKIEGANVKGGGYVFSKERVSTEAPDAPDSITIDGQVLIKSKKLLNELSGKKEPFFLAVGFHKPHLPFVAPKKYWDLYERDEIQVHPFQEHAVGTPEFAYQPGWELRSLYTDIPKEYSMEIAEEKQKELIHGYYACVSFIDQQIGHLIDYLNQLKLRENTVIVLWGDHGWHLGDHGMWCKHTNFEQATRSPLIIAYDKDFTGTTQSPTEFVDVFPTICDITGVQAPADLEGESLVPIMSGEQEKVKPAAISQFQRNKVLMGYAFRNERYRYVVWLKNSYRSYMPFDKELIIAQELYDYEVDPLETKNFIHDPEYAGVKSEMEKMSEEFFESKQQISLNE